MSVIEAPPEFEIPQYHFEPITIGKTWERDESGDFVMPERTLGWQVVKWVRENLQAPEGGAFNLTPEQLRFVLWWYAVDHRGKFVYRDGICQRIKGWG